MLQDSEAGSRLLQRSQSADSTEDRLASSKGASSSTTGCFSVVQEGFTEGIVSLKEAAVYISRRENRCGAARCADVDGVGLKMHARALEACSHHSTLSAS